MNRILILVAIQAVFLAGIIFFTPSVNEAGTDIIFICNTSAPFDSITKTEIKEIFLGRKLNWTPDKEITFVILKKPEIYTQFTRNYVKKTRSQFHSYWRLMLFTGRAMMPDSFNTEKEIVDYVATTDGAIGYVSSMTKVKNVKILTVSDK